MLLHPQFLCHILLITSTFVHQVLATNCAVDQTLPETAPGNSYECPDLLPDGTPNEYNQCCYNDRPDSEGNYHSCCQDESEKNKAKMSSFTNTLITIGSITAGIMAAIFIYTYCREDTFPWLRHVRRFYVKHKNNIMDYMCFCKCLPKRFQRNPKSNEIPDDKTQPTMNVAYTTDDPTKNNVVIDPFWA